MSHLVSFCNLDVLFCSAHLLIVKYYQVLFLAVDTPSYPQYLGMAATAGRCKELLIAVFTIHRSLFFHKAYICQRCTAVDTVEFLLVPGFSHCHQKRSSEIKQGEIMKKHSILLHTVPDLTLKSTGVTTRSY